MRLLRKNTAVFITVGPFYDATDGVTIESSLTITNEEITLTADTDDNSAPTLILDNIPGATGGTSNDLNYITGNDAGLMQMELSAANTNRLGRMTLTITDSAHRPVVHELMVVNAALYDAFFAASGGAIPNVAAGVSTGLLINGSNSGDVTLAALTVTGATTHTGTVTLSDGLVVSRSTNNTHAVTFTGAGTGSGLRVVAGATGSGMAVVGGSSSGAGLVITTTSGLSLSLADVGVAGDFEIGGSFNMNGFANAGQTDFADIVVNGAIDVSGITTLHAIAATSITASGAVTLNSLTVSNNFLVSGNATVTGTTVHTGNYSHSGTTTYTGAVSHGSTFTVTGATTLTGAVSLGSTLGITGGTTFTGAIIANHGSNSISGIVLADGAITSTKFAAGAITAAAIATGAVDADALATDAVAEITAATDVVLSAAHGSGAWGSNAGIGAYTVTVTVTNIVGAVPLEGANVRLVKGATDLVAQTNASGVATFALDAGTWTRAITLTGFTQTPDTIVVSGAANFATTMAATFVPSAPSNPAHCLISGYVRSTKTGLLLAGVTVTATLTGKPPHYSGGFLVGKTVSAVSGSGGSLGLVQLEVLQSDQITPAGSQWRITCPQAGLDSTQTLDGTTFDLSTA